MISGVPSSKYGGHIVVCGALNRQCPDFRLNEFLLMVFISSFHLFSDKI